MASVGETLFELQLKQQMMRQQQQLQIDQQVREERLAEREYQRKTASDVFNREASQKKLQQDHEFAMAKLQLELETKAQDAMALQRLRNEGGTERADMRNQNAIDVTGLRNEGALDVAALRNQGALDVARLRNQAAYGVANIRMQGAPVAPEDRSAIAGAIANNRMGMPSGTALRAMGGQQLVADVLKQNPQYDASVFPSIQATRTDFAKGKAANNVRSLNTFMNHVGEMDAAAQDLNTTDVKFLNRPINWVRTNMGDHKYVRFNVAAQAAISEAVNLFKGTGATDQEIAQMRHDVDSAQSPAQLMAAAKTLVHLAQGRMKALQQQWRNAIPDQAVPQFISPDAQQVLQGRLGDGGAPQVAPTQRPSALDALKAVLAEDEF